MDLVIDQGNTFCKLALFEEDQMVVHRRLENRDLTPVKAFLEGYVIERAILSSVSDPFAIKTMVEGAGIQVLVLTKDCKFPISVSYGTPETLGLDRLVAAVGAWKMSSVTTNLIIDIGTAVTYDVATVDGGFVGGNIAPGLDMRLKAMNAFTQKLPLLERKENGKVFGSNTNEAVRNGAQQGIVAEIEYYISEAQLQYKEISVFLTGGDAPFFEQSIKSSIFAVPNLVMLGLLEILKIN